MKTRSIFALVVLMFMSTVIISAQTFVPKHRGKHPSIQNDGKVVDENGKQLGYITEEGKVCDIDGTVIGIIAENGDVKTANQKKIIGVTKKDGSFESKKGYVITVGDDGAVMHSGKKVGKIDKDYKNKSHACAVHCFFSEDNEDVKDIDENVK